MRQHVEKVTRLQPEERKKPMAEIERNADRTQNLLGRAQRNPWCACHCLLGEAHVCARVWLLGVEGIMGICRIFQVFGGLLSGLKIKSTTGLGRGQGAAKRCCHWSLVSQNSYSRIDVALCVPKQKYNLQATDTQWECRYRVLAVRDLFYDFLSWFSVLRRKQDSTVR